LLARGPKPRIELWPEEGDSREEFMDRGVEDLTKYRHNVSQITEGHLFSGFDWLPANPRTIAKGGMPMTDMSKPTSSERKVRFEGRVLTDHELDAISGGQLSSMVSQVIKNFGEALKASGRS